MGEGQPHEVDVIGAEQSDRVPGGCLVEPVVVRDLCALGATGGAGGVDDRRQIFGFGGVDAGADAPRILGQASLTGSLHVTPADDAGILAGALEQDDLLDPDVLGGVHLLQDGGEDGLILSHHEA